MNDTKNTLLIIAGVVAVFLGVIYGLSKMSTGETTTVKVDNSKLVEGARFVKENSSTDSGQIKATVVVFADIQCPSCKAAEQQLKPLQSMIGVKYVMRQFPLPANIHKYALISAKAVEAARVMGKGWEMMELMFEKQSDWSNVSKPEKLFAEYAKGLGLDEKKFLETMNSGEVAQFVATDSILADSLKLSGTPTIFVNGEQVGVPFVMDKVKEILAK